jgi:hypothetical protein
MTDVGRMGRGDPKVGEKLPQNIFLCSGRTADEPIKQNTDGWKSSVLNIIVWA